MLIIYAYTDFGVGIVIVLSVGRPVCQAAFTPRLGAYFL